MWITYWIVKYKMHIKIAKPNVNLNSDLRMNISLITGGGGGPYLQLPDPFNVSNFELVFFYLFKGFFGISKK